MISGIPLFTGDLVFLDSLRHDIQLTLKKFGCEMVNLLLQVWGHRQNKGGVPSGSK